jgi:hypothetical protein
MAMEVMDVVHCGLLLLFNLDCGLALGPATKKTAAKQ